MATGQVPSLEFEGLPYGSNEAANDAATEAEIDDELFGEDDDDYVPVGPEEEFLLGPTDRPDEPLTAGAGFGPGLDASRFAFSTDEDMLNQLAEKVRANAAADPQARAWANLRAKGL